MGMSTARTSSIPLASTRGPTGVKKRGWPKGKPRKGANASVAKGKKIAKAEQPKFPFMKLLPELRREIYSLVLPQQDVQSRSSGWLTMDETPNDFMNLLLVNKQVSEEARSVLYGVNTFTMVISEYQTFFLGSFTEQQFLPFLTKPSLPFIKNWQIALWPNERHMGDQMNWPGPCFHDTVLSACSEIAKTQALQKLKLSIPCLCKRTCEYGGYECHCRKDKSMEDTRDIFLNLFTPFNQLRFKGKVELVATPEPAEQLWSDENYGTPSRFPESDDRPGYTRISKYSHHQCQEPRCVSFAASFGPVMATLMGDTTPDRLTEHQREWLDLKKRVAETKNYLLGRGIKTLAPTIALDDLWAALDSRESRYFEKEKHSVDLLLNEHLTHTYHGR
ncbi:MAG: hypothetical protein LQ349_008186 [Xanthoria aureola]|nr:MAG: hypothetical protein LQ349_008186 [Xanthoria aureola]